jgi:hypothetical protein
MPQSKICHGFLRDYAINPKPYTAEIRREENEIDVFARRNRVIHRCIE